MSIGDQAEQNSFISSFRKPLLSEQAGLAQTFDVSRDKIELTGKKMPSLYPVNLNYKNNKLNQRKKRISTENEPTNNNFLMAKSALNTTMSLNQENV